MLGCAFARVLFAECDFRLRAFGVRVHEFGFEDGIPDVVIERVAFFVRADDNDEFVVGGRGVGDDGLGSEHGFSPPERTCQCATDGSVSVWCRWTVECVNFERMKHLLIGLALLVGCSTPTDPNALPDGYAPFAPPTIYREYWSRVEHCTGLRGHFDQVQWFAYRNHWIIPDPDTAVHTYGRSRWRRHEIYLAKLALQQSAYVRHEMLHEILQARTVDAATNDHPAKWFDRKTGLCAAEITCEHPLVTDSTGTHEGCSDLAALFP